jgi:hypothetical protein
VRYPAVKAGERLYARPVQSFSYVKARPARGEPRLPDDARPLSSFGQGAKAAIYDRGEG